MFFVSLKELAKFNDAMLARHVWRLLKDQNSFFYRVFKAKYFPRGSVFEASAATGSFAWQSILKARKVVSLGMRWRLGDGRSIKIYDDSWLPGKESAKVLSPRISALEGATVDCLIRPDTRTWDHGLIDQLFLWFEAQRIKAIPLCWSSQANSII